MNKENEVMFGKKARVTVTLFFLTFTGLLVALQPAAGAERLTSAQMERLKACEDLIQGADQKSFEEITQKLEAASNPEENLQLKEAVARTYSEMAQEYKVEDQKKKEWLYSMVELNMAYLQLGGIQVAEGNQDALSRAICRKLKKNLSSDLLKHSGIFYSLE